MQEIWNPFHRQNYLTLKGFSNFERTNSKSALPFLQMFITFANQNLAVLYVKRPWNGFRFSGNFWCCMWSINNCLGLCLAMQQEAGDHAGHIIICQRCNGSLRGRSSYYYIAQFAPWSALSFSIYLVGRRHAFYFLTLAKNYLNAFWFVLELDCHSLLRFQSMHMAQYFCKRSRSRFRLKKIDPESGLFLTGWSC